MNIDILSKIRRAKPFIKVSEPSTANVNCYVASGASIEIPLKDYYTEVEVSAGGSFFISWGASVAAEITALSTGQFREITSGFVVRPALLSQRYAIPEGIKSIFVNAITGSSNRCNLSFFKNLER